MFSVMDLLTEKDKTLIDSYRFKAPMGEYTDMGSRCSVDYFLRFWKQGKDNYLRNIFKDKLIIEEPFEYNVSKKELQKSMEALINQSSYGDHFASYKFNCQQEFYNSFCRAVFDDCYGIKNKYFEIREWFSPESLAKNKQLTDTFFIEDRNGKCIKFQKGSKVIRNIRKVAELLDVPNFNDFCNAHSQILNQKVVKGTLCLSIHPLDYMTMSDNNEGWSSCMSWEDSGCYCAGTLEMMNSENVVVAYLASDTKKLEFYDYAGHGRDLLTWNSKKWRTLVVLNEDVISSVKAYPYQNDALSSTVVKKLAMLMEEHCNAKYHSIEPEPIEYEEDYGAFINCPDENNRIRLIFGTSYMYNDFGCVDHHMMVFSEEFISHRITTGSKIWYDYSGNTVCVCCGDDCVSGEECLACDNCCGEQYYCYSCGSRIHEEDMYYFDGETMCEDCFENETFMCPVAQERYWRNNDGTEIYLTVPEQVQKTICCRSCTVATEMLNTDEFIEMFGPLEERTETTHYGWTSTYRCVSIENLNSEGKNVFDLYSDADVKYYTNRMKGND